MDIFLGKATKTLTSKNKMYVVVINREDNFFFRYKWRFPFSCVLKGIFLWDTSNKEIVEIILFDNSNRARKMLRNIYIE